MDKRSTDKSDQAVDLEQSSKRKLVKGIAAAPVIMALGHRPAFGTVCTLSGFASIKAGAHLSHTAYKPDHCKPHKCKNWKHKDWDDPDWDDIKERINPCLSFKYCFTGSSGCRPPNRHTTKWYTNHESKYKPMANKFCSSRAEKRRVKRYTERPDDDPIIFESLKNGDEVCRELSNAIVNACYAEKFGITFFAVDEIIDLWNHYQARSSNGNWVPSLPMSDAELVDLLRETYS
ncbi:hypothetical protein [Motiliproteus sp.]|uniref:hypothetical protein n=1 Tax=Motiliproteus sp. TaxID=1898955 RepID=UPI003BACD05D